jgi:serine/threonine protein kinase
MSLFITQIAMEICERAQMFIEQGDDCRFDHTKIILRRGDNEYFYAKTSLRIPQSSQINANELEIIPIPAGHIWPLADSTITRAPEPPPSSYYLKRPSFLYYDETSGEEEYSRQILTEVEACEVLRLHPHPNIARYMGCIVEDGRIRGLYFVKYCTTLSQMLKYRTHFDRSRFLREIKAGVSHMHDLGLIHNDLNPSNIMTDGNSAIIVDFDSCKKEGDKLGSKTGTHGWTLDDVEYARRENDFYSISLIAEALGREISDDQRMCR